MSRATAAFFNRDCDVVARALIGATLLVDGVGGTIVETESYDGEDPASHSYPMRMTARNSVMFGPPARIYVYKSYGIHGCLNFVCRPGSAVLIRALEPTAGLATMTARRGEMPVARLCAGPGRLCQALNISDTLNGKSLLRAPFSLVLRPPISEISVGPRIGITKAIDAPRRFGLQGSKFLSKPFK